MRNAGLDQPYAKPECVTSLGKKMEGIDHSPLHVDVNVEDEVTKVRF